ncbi:MAG: formylglycine-generating enzyme family protein, partial [Anaerolineae bacterium]|nr:formylglycine-generating enzyme family protein [Anaerolineae bacterium]
APLPQPPDLSGILPPPFEWIHIPAGKVTLEAGGYVPKGGQTFDVPMFYIAKYPVTNAQYAKFIKAGGYNNRQWWTDAGWKQKESQNWAEPRFWRDKKWNGEDYPVVGVSWYESLAFSNWLSAAVGATDRLPQKITLPTEQQWQRAAQGDDRRKYPWGRQWDVSRCNTEESNINRTTPVQQYEGKGDGPYGVVDMAGNAWEWCMTNWEDGSIDPTGNLWCVRRGGSCLLDNFYIRVAYRDPWTDLDERLKSQGFRLVYIYAIS